DPGPADALDDPRFCAALLGQIRANGTLAGRRGQFRFRATPALAEILPGPPATAVRVRTEPSNTSVGFDARASRHIYPRLDPEPTPDFEITDFLRRATDFRAAPRLAGSIEYEVAGQEPITLGTLSEFIANHGDAWTHLQARLGEYLAAAVTGPDGVERP